ncbi:leucine Rich repeat-containing domain protein, partial [Ostertagia ostertagi]
MRNRALFLQLMFATTYLSVPGLSSAEKAGDKQSDDSTEGGWLACDGSELEACHCEQEEINCDNVVFKDESPLSTANLDINNKTFRVERATFRENSITSLRQGRIIPGHQGTVRELDFSHNRIVYIESGTFSSFRALKKLYLTGNKLNQLKKDQFLGLSELHQLFLDNNRITSLQDGVFEHLTNLRRLVLDENKVKIRKDLFKGLESLEELSLDNCDIKELDVDVFDAI